MSFFSFTKAGETRRFGKGGAGWLLPMLLICALAVIAAGCHSSTGTSDGGSSSSQDDVVAKVNDDTITVGEMYDYMRRLTPQQMASNPSAPVGKFALAQLINGDLLVQMAKSKSVPVTDQEIEQRYKDLGLVESWEFPVPYEQYLSSSGQTPESLKQYGLRPEMAQFNLMTRNVQVTPAEMQAYYNSHKSLYTIPAAAEVERVVVPSQAAAEQIYESASKGTPFMSFQSQSEATPTPGADPTLIPQWLPTNPPSKALGPLAAPLSKAKAGDTLKPIQVGLGWWVVHVLAARPATVIPYDQVQDIVRNSMLQTKAGPQAASDLAHDAQEFNSTAVITIKPPEYQDIAQMIKTPAPQPGVGMGSGAPTPSGAPAPAPSSAPAPAPEPNAPPKK